MELGNLNNRSTNVSTSIKMSLLMELKARGIKVSKALELGARKLLSPDEDVEINELKTKIEKLSLLLNERSIELTELKEQKK